MENAGICELKSKSGPLLQTRRDELIPMAAILTAVLLWGGSFTAMRISIRALDPWSVMWIRMATAFVILLPFSRKLMPHDYRKGDWKRLLPMVIFLPCSYFFFESNALRFTTSSQAGVISASVPLLVAAGAWCFLSEPVSVRTGFGLAFSITGVICLTLTGEADGSAVNPLLGNGMEFLAMASAAASMIIVKQLSARYNPWTLTAMQVSAGTIFFLPGLSHLIRAGLTPWTWQVTISLAFLGIFVTLGAFGLYNWGMSRMSAGKAAIFINLVPVTAVILGWMLLDERLNLPQMIAASAVIGGVMLSQGRS